MQKRNEEIPNHTLNHIGAKRALYGLHHGRLLHMLPLLLLLLLHVALFTACLASCRSRSSPISLSLSLSLCLSH